MGRPLMDIIGERPRPVAHPGPCGNRLPTPCGVMLGPYLPAETLPGSLDVLCHLCGGRYRPHELPQAAHCHRRTAG